MRLRSSALLYLTALLNVSAQHFALNIPLKPFVLTLIRDVDYGSCTVASFTDAQKHRLLSNYSDVIIERTVTFKAAPNTGVSEQLQVIGYIVSNLWTRATELCPGLKIRETQDESEFTQIIQHHQHVFSTTHPIHRPPLEVHPLVLSGPSENRVDLMFLSDGYTIHEKDKFLADAKRLALDISQNQTFAAVQPLMNFWAAFSPSRESGIGVTGAPKDTTFGLYRDGSELRAVYCSKRDVARDACLSLRGQCDFPILLANDPLYGGLGGEFTISTASELNGALVLRHELGHSIIGIGEEYDGGFSYFGVNTVQNVSESTTFKWLHWLLPPLPPGAAPRIERAIMPFQVYPWTFLNKTSPWVTTFLSSGLYSRYLVRFSLSGLPLAEDLKVQLDGDDLGWTPLSNIKLDRWHYDIHRSKPLLGGRHELSFTLGESAQEGIAQLCSAEIIEYGNEYEFNSSVGYYGAFPTFSNKNVTTFRPTNEACLMRVLTSPSFCSVCLEGLWLSLLKRVTLIDDFLVTLPAGAIASTEPLVLELILVPFGQLRNHMLHGMTEIYTIMWEKDDLPLPHFANATKITVDKDVEGTWRVFVQLHTMEVKEDPNQLLTSRAEVQVVEGTAPKPVLYH